jgi:hypothetical protein
MGTLALQTARGEGVVEGPVFLGLAQRIGPLPVNLVVFKLFAEKLESRQTITLATPGDVPPRGACAGPRF